VVVVLIVVLRIRNILTVMIIMLMMKYPKRLTMMAMRQFVMLLHFWKRSDQRVKIRASFGETTP